MKIKSILIEDWHDQWIQDRSINFSDWVRKKIEDEANKDKLKAR